MNPFCNPESNLNKIKNQMSEIYGSYERHKNKNIEQNFTEGFDCCFKLFDHFIYDVIYLYKDSEEFYRIKDFLVYLGYSFDDKNNEK